jgi:glycosyltransferase involved in cell wall biosynthesis
MRVIYFSNGFGPHDERFLTALAGTRHEVHFLRLEGHPTPALGTRLPRGIRPVEWAGIRGSFRWWDVPRLVFGLRRVLQEVKPDLIHAGPIQTCAFVAVLSGFRPVLTMSWGFDLMQDAERSPWWRWVTSYVLRRSAFFVSDARITRSRAVAFGMPAEKTAVFPWGVDLRRFRPVRRSVARGAQSAGSGRDTKRTLAHGAKKGIVLLCNRSWEKRYGVDVLARAFAMTASRLPGASLIMVGDGSQGETIRAILERGHVLDRVQFRGRIDESDMPPCYREADLFISPSHVDGSSVSLLEALASGTPVLVSDIPANREWVSEDGNGWLFRDGDAYHLAERILSIVRRRADLARIGRAGRKTAEERADWRRNFKVLLQAYEKAVAPDGQW